MYASTDAYKAHLEAPHFKKYKTDDGEDGQVAPASANNSDCARGEA